MATTAERRVDDFASAKQHRHEHDAWEGHDVDNDDDDGRNTNSGAGGGDDDHEAHGEDDDDDSSANTGRLGRRDAPVLESSILPSEENANQSRGASAGENSRTDENLFPSARASCRAERPALRRPQQLAHSNRHAFSSPSGRDKPPPPPGGGRERAHAAIKGEGNKSERIKERERERKTELKLETYFSPPPVASLLLAKFPPLFISQFCLPSVASFSYSASPFPIRPSQYFFGGQRSKCLPFALPSLSQVFTPSSLPFSYPLPQFLTRELIFLYVSLLPPVFFRFFFSSNFHISTRRWRRWRPARERATMFGRFSREREKQERKNDRGNFNTGVKNKKKQYREIHIRRDRRASGTEKTKAENTGERF